MTAELRWLPAVAEDDLWEGDLLDVELDDDQVLLVHLDGGPIKAYQGLCPHQEVLLADGTWDVDTGRLECPGHRWEFDMVSGAGLNPQGCQLFEYPVRVQDGKVEVGIPQDGERHYHRFSNQAE